MREHITALAALLDAQDYSKMIANGDLEPTKKGFRFRLQTAMSRRVPGIVSTGGL